MDGPTNARIYYRFIGCQVSTVLDLKKDRVALSVPSSVVVTYCRKGRRQTAPWRVVAALQTGWRGGRTSAPRLAAGGASDAVVQGNVPGIPHPPTL